MSAAAVPGFDEWVNYCFTQGYVDFSNPPEEDDDKWERRRTRFLSLPGSVLASYMTGLFNSCAHLADGYSDQQIAGATWFLFGIASGYFHSIRDVQVPVAVQVRCYRAVATTYIDLYDRVCGDRGQDPDTDLRGRGVDMAVYMIWD